MSDPLDLDVIRRRGPLRGWMRDTIDQLCDAVEERDRALAECEEALRAADAVVAERDRIIEERDREITALKAEHDETTIYVHLSSGLWPEGTSEPPPTVHALGDPDAVKALKAFIAKADESDREITRLRGLIIDITLCDDERFPGDDHGQLLDVIDRARAAVYARENQEGQT